MRRLRPPPNSTVYPYTTLFRSHATSPEYGTDGTGDDASGGVGTRPAPPSVNPGHGLRAPCEISATGSRVSIMSRAITGGRVRSSTCVTRSSLMNVLGNDVLDLCDEVIVAEHVHLPDAGPVPGVHPDGIRVGLHRQARGATYPAHQRRENCSANTRHSRVIHHESRRPDYSAILHVRAKLVVFIRGLGVFPGSAATVNPCLQRLGNEQSD